VTELFELLHETKLWGFVVASMGSATLTLPHDLPGAAPASGFTV
jgi:hypothetical protein